MYTFLLIRENWLRGYDFPWWYYPICLFFDILIVLVVLAMLVIV